MDLETAKTIIRNQEEIYNLSLLYEFLFDTLKKEGITDKKKLDEWIKKKESEVSK